MVDLFGNADGSTAMAAKKEVPTLYEYQERAVQRLRDNLLAGVERQILGLPTGSGKCLGFNTMVMAANGGAMPVQDVKSGDRLMGPEGPVTVSRVGVGHGVLYEIRPVKGKPWRVNGDHVLSLINNDKRDAKHQEIVDVPVVEWLQWPKSRKHIHKLYRARSSFPTRDQLIPPYLVGALLGDGSLKGSSVRLFTADFEVAVECVRFAATMGTGVRLESQSGQCIAIHFRTRRGQPNPLLNACRAIGIMGPGARDKRLPEQYVYAAENQQLEVLAGLLDSDGSLGGGFDFLSKSPVLAEQVTFLARSLGLAAYGSEKWVPYRGKRLRFHRVFISGHCDRVPTRIPRKQAAPRKQIKNVLHTGFVVEGVGEGAFYGFELTESPYFLLWDHTVTHNTVVSASMCQTGLARAKRIGFMVDRIALVTQTSDRFHEFGLPHGVLQAGNTHGRERPLQIGSIQTIEKRGFWPNLDFGFVDECHAQRESVQQFMVESDIPWIGLSATPITKGLGRELETDKGKPKRVWEKCVVVATTDELIASKHLTPVRVYRCTEIDMRGANTNSGTGEWTGGEVERRGRKIIGDIVEEWRTHTDKIFGGPVKTLVFSATVKHGEDICQQFQRSGYDFRQISYLDRNDEYRNRLIQLYRQGRINGLVACEALSRGFDVPDTLCLIAARPYRTSLAAWIQQLGRGMRSAPGKDFCLVLDHVGNWNGFEEDLLEFFRYGPPEELDEGKQKGPLHKRDEEYKGRECECGMLLPPRAKMCPACGKEVSRRKDYEIVDGQMEETRGAQGGVGWNDPKLAEYVWEQCCLFAHIKRRSADAKVKHNYAQAAHKALTGVWARPYNRALVYAKNLDPNLTKDVYAAWSRNKRKRQTVGA